MRPLALAAICACASCAFSLDDGPPAPPLLGAPIDASSLAHLNAAPVASEAIVFDRAGRAWVAMVEPDALESVLLSDPTTAQVVPVPAHDEVHLFPHALVLIDGERKGSDPRAMSVRTVGEAVEETFSLPPGPGRLVANGDQSIFLWLPMAPGTPGYPLFRRDGSFARVVPLPAGIDPSQQSPVWLSPDSKLVLTRDSSGDMAAYSTSSPAEVDLGTHPIDFAFDDARAAIVTVGADGVHRVSLDGGGDQVLDPQPCLPGFVLIDGPNLLYETGGAAGPALLAIALDGSEAAAHVLRADDFARVIALAPNGDVVYSKDPSDRFAAGSGDGWIGDWSFMERGRAVGFSADGTRMRWLDHTAQLSTQGDLRSAPATGGPATTWARNVSRFDELPDGRFVALADDEQTGPWNRIVVMDERAGTATWVASNTVDYILVPADDLQLIVDVAAGALGHDVARAPIPLR